MKVKPVYVQKREIFCHGIFQRRKTPPLQIAHDLRPPGRSPLPMRATTLAICDNSLYSLDTHALLGNPQRAQLVV